MKTRSLSKLDSLSKLSFLQNSLQRITLRERPHPTHRIDAIQPTKPQRTKPEKPIFHSIHQVETLRQLQQTYFLERRSIL